MWIMLIKKLPTEVSPPKLSMFWALPWPNEKLAGEQLDITDNPDDIISRAVSRVRGTHKYHSHPDPSKTYIETPFGKEPNWAGAMKIRYKGKDIRVFPHEFSTPNLENMRLYILGCDGGSPSHYLQTSDDYATLDIKKIIKDTDLRDIRDAALLDGCNEQQAFLVAAGQDVTDEELEFAPIGWYKCHPEYAKLFCTESEMKE